MNLRDLEYLVALDDHRHFGRAADAVHVSQPTLSTQIKKLETELGLVLVERASRRVLPTEAGRVIVERARATLSCAQDIKRSAKRLRDPEAQTVRLGIFPTLGPYLLPHALPLIRARYPRLELLLVEEKTDEILARLHAGALDAVLVALPAPTDESFASRVLFDEPFVLATPRNHPLSKRASVTTDDLVDRDLLLLEEGHCLRDQALDVCRSVGAHEHDGFRATSLETLRYMVAAGVGVTLLPALATQPPTAQVHNLKLTPFSGEPPHRRIAMLWRHSSAIDGALAGLADVLQTLPPSLFNVTQ